MIEILAIVPGGMAALVIVSMNHHHILVLGVASDFVARSTDIRVATLRRCRRIVYRDIVNEPVYPNKKRKKKSTFALSTFGTRTNASKRIVGFT